MYRNDYDAAVARIDVLEGELQQSRAERNQLVRRLTAMRLPKKRALGKVMSGIALALLCAAALYLRVHHSQTVAAETARPQLDAYGAYDNSARQVCELP
jgi:hypothetical protein